MNPIVHREVTINAETVKDLLISYLYSISALDDDISVINSTLSLTGKGKFVTIKMETVEDATTD